MLRKLFEVLHILQGKVGNTRRLERFTHIIQGAHTHTQNYNGNRSVKRVSKMCKSG